MVMIMPNFIIRLIRMVITVFLMVIMFDYLNFLGLVIMVVAFNLAFDYLVRKVDA